MVRKEKEGLLRVPESFITFLKSKQKTELGEKVLEKNVKLFDVLLDMLDKKVELEFNVFRIMKKVMND